MKSTLVLKIEYDGTNYGGWQIQQNKITIQETIQSAFNKLAGFEINLIGAGRTDAGVHARGMIAHAVLEDSLKIPDTNLPKVINSYLPSDIRILNSKITESKFHARYNAIAREYSYSIHSVDSVLINRFSTLVNYKINNKKIFDSAKLFAGKHDFTAFSKNNPDTKSYICNVEKCKWEQISNEQMRLTIKADRFVYGMVRSIVGAMLDVARGKKSISEIRQALNKAERTDISSLAKPNGLILEKIYYPKDLDFFD